MSSAPGNHTALLPRSHASTLHAEPAPRHAGLAGGGRAPDSRVVCELAAQFLVAGAQLVRQVPGHLGHVVRSL
jgi:hypothetical protein